MSLIEVEMKKLLLLILLILCLSSPAWGFTSFGGGSLVYCTGGTPTDGQYPQWVASTSCFQGSTPSGAGDTAGAAASSNGELPLFSGTGGKTLKRSNTLTGIPLLTSGVVTMITETDGYVIYGTGSAWSKSNAPAVSAANMTSFPTLNQDTTGTAAKATALAANGANCSAGQAPLGVDTAGAAEGCFAVLTPTTGVNVDQTSGQTIGTTGARLTKLWATDLTVTNAISGSVTGASGSTTGNAATVTGFSPAGGKTLTLSKTITLTAADDALSLNISTGGTLGTGAFATIANYAPLDSPTFTTFVKLPNGASPTVDAAGKTAVVTTATTGGIQVYTDSSHKVPVTYTKCQVLGGAVGGASYPMEYFPYAITVTGMHCYALGGTSVTGAFDDCTGTNGVCSSITAFGSDMTCTAASDVTGTVTHTSVPANHWIQWHNTSASGTNLSLSMCFTYNVN